MPRCLTCDGRSKSMMLRQTPTGKHFAACLFEDGEEKSELPTRAKTDNPRFCHSRSTYRSRLNAQRPFVAKQLCDTGSGTRSIFNFFWVIRSQDGLHPVYVHAFTRAMNFSNAVGCCATILRVGSSVSASVFWSNFVCPMPT
jgi:hypothetical protein